MFRIIRTLICLGLAVAVVAETHTGAQSSRKKRGEVDMKGETIFASPTPASWTTCATA
jgi:hypothetical protein